MPTQLTSGAITVEITSDAILTPRPQAVCGEIEEQLREALEHPLGLPRLNQCCVPGDRVLLVIDPQTPWLTEILTALLAELRTVAEPGLSLGILLPPDPAGNHWDCVRQQLPHELRDSASFVCHDPRDLAGNSYVASTEAGERIYLSNEIAEADLLITVGILCFDQLLGIRGTTSGIFPAMADKDTLERTGMLDARPATSNRLQERRALIDEIGWLVGAQFSLQIIPAPGGPGALIAGSPQDVMDTARPLLTEFWELQLEEQPEVILTSIPAGQFGWSMAARTLASLNELLDADSRIILIADLPVPDGPAARALRTTQDPAELARRLRKESVEDGIEIGQLIAVTQEQRVYLLSSLEAELVEDLGLLPLANQQELDRLLQTIPDYVVIPDACYARCRLA